SLELPVTVSGGHLLSVRLVLDFTQRHAILNYRRFGSVFLLTASPGDDPSLQDSKSRGLPTYPKRHQPRLLRFELSSTTFGGLASPSKFQTYSSIYSEHCFFKNFSTLVT